MHTVERLVLRQFAVANVTMHGVIDSTSVPKTSALGTGFRSCTENAAFCGVFLFSHEHDVKDVLTSPLSWDRLRLLAP
jgi:hypothetical protein